jgi:hypothetical protein
MRLAQLSSAIFAEGSAEKSAAQVADERYQDEGSKRLPLLLG